MIPFNIVPQTFPGYGKKKKEYQFCDYSVHKKRKYFTSLFISSLELYRFFVSIDVKRPSNHDGCRISEFLDLKKENVHLEEQYFDVIASKTENGLRKVPIPDKLLPFYQEWYARHPGCELPSGRLLDILEL